MPRWIKSVLGRIAYRTGLYRLFFRNKALIVLFHRVDDSLGDDPISCTSATFRAYCDFFREYFHVVSLAELLRRLEKGETIRRRVVITFDDGYKDNFQIAAAELERRGLTACFFIATGFIGTERVPAWDAGKSIRSAWMDWDDVRSLDRRGFELGAHTMDHVDLGKVEGPEAATEIAGSKERLERELGRPVVFFSYPFGARRNFTEENRAEVRRAGFSCCLSAFGGSVAPGTSPFRLARMPVSPWYRSPYQFGFEAMREPAGPPGQRVRPEMAGEPIA
ncbi:MAG: polysaccharide deacetylase family protein [Candidatus Eisenbacteria bacterium]